LWISPFFNLIEITSLSIRPVTLTLRLGINLNIGHFLTHRVSSLKISGFTCFLFSYEVGVCLIQALVFNTLLKQYHREL
jgi:F0F1-type ATP synthase membrane subunit a